MKSKEQKCDMCKADIANDQMEPDNPCAYHTRISSAAASKDQHNIPSDVWEAVKIQDAEMRREYEYNKERFGETTKATAIFTGMVLIASGLADIIRSIKIDSNWLNHLHWTSGISSGVFLIGAGIAAVLGLRAYWHRTEKMRDHENKKRRTSTP